MGDQTDNRVNAAPSADGIAAAASKAGKKGLPPVHLWDPPFCGDLDMQIKADGTWFYEGTPIGRPAMVRLFSTVLKREGDDYFLVTPVEKVGIQVEDAPFIAVDAEILPDQITFTTNVGDELVANADNPIIIRGDAAEPRPYVHVRRGLEALIDRKTFYRLAAAADDGPDGRVGVRSGGCFFPLEP